MAVTRWHEDSTCDDRGSFCYLRDGHFSFEAGAANGVPEQLDGLPSVA
jgi:hypothetical protein